LTPDPLAPHVPAVANDERAPAPSGGPDDEPAPAPSGAPDDEPAPAPSGAPDDERAPAPSDEPAPRRPSLAPPNRLARFLLLGGGLCAAAQLLPQLPRERRLALRLDDPTTVTSVEVTWTRDGREDALAGASFRFEAGRAPRRLESTVRLPNGAYDVEVVVLRADGPRTLRRPVTLEGGDEITLTVPR
jgi:hypothetical protein